MFAKWDCIKSDVLWMRDDGAMKKRIRAKGGIIITITKATFGDGGKI